MSSSRSGRFTATAIRLMEKQQELSALVELNQLSHGMAVQLEELSQQFALGAHGALSVLYPLSPPLGSLS